MMTMTIIMIMTGLFIMPMWIENQICTKQNIIEIEDFEDVVRDQDMIWTDSTINTPHLLLEIRMKYGQIRRSTPPYLCQYKSKSAIQCEDKSRKITSGL